MLFSYLQKVVNGGALAHRQFAEGRGAVDISLTFRGHEYLIEIKLAGSKAVEDCLERLSGYLNSNGEREAWLVIFDRSSNVALTAATSFF
jgi:hypothetical protein